MACQVFYPSKRISLCTPHHPHWRYKIVVSSLTIIVISISVSRISSLLLFSDSPQLQSLLRLNVSQVQVDECVRTDCKTSGGCSTQLGISDSPTLVDSGALSLVSVKVTSSAVCGCAARVMTHQPCSSYASNPCLNGGTCVDTQSGYRWEACVQMFRSTETGGRSYRNGNRNRSFPDVLQSSLQSCPTNSKSDILEKSRIIKLSPCEKNLLHLQLDLTCLSCSAVLSAEYRVAGFSKGFGLFAIEAICMYVHIIFKTGLLSVSCQDD